MHVLTAVCWPTRHVLCCIDIALKAPVIVNCCRVILGVLIWWIFSIEHVVLRSLKSLYVVQDIFNAFKNISACSASFTSHSLLSISANLVLVCEGWLRSFIMNSKPLWIRHVLKAASRLIEILSKPCKFASHGTCSFSASSLSTNLDIIVSILCKLYLWCDTSSWLDWMTCLRDCRLRWLLFMAWILLKVDTF